MFKITPLALEGIVFIIYITYILIRWKVAPFVTQVVRRYGEEIKRIIKGKTNQLNLTAGRF